MFERFTRAARDVVTGAVTKGEAEGVVLPEHLVLALLDSEGTTGAGVLAHFGVDPEAVAAAVRANARRGGMGESDAAALAELGIDLDAVVAAVERAHGTGALAPRRARRRFHTPFAAESKKVLERALREALDQGDRFIGDEHLLLALLAEPAGEALGLNHSDVRAHLAKAS
ncbi:Clp protease N-terminal domain-containing protein [Actinokineospora sp. 24-640]